jgi:hypothetical protein
MNHRRPRRRAGSRIVLLAVLISCYVIPPQRLYAQVSFVVVAKTGDPAPGLNANFTSLSPPFINNAGLVAFEGTTPFLPRSEPSAGAYVGRPGNLQLVAKRGDTPPGGPADAFFSTLNVAGLNESGQVMLISLLGGPSLPPKDIYGYWSGVANQTPTYIARVLAPAQGLPGGITYWSTNQPQSAGGRIIFDGVLTNVASADGPAVLWGGSLTGFNVIARQNGIPPGVNDAYYGGAFYPAINAAGQIAFSAPLVPSIGPYSRQSGLWFGTTATQQLVLRSGQPAPQTDKMLGPISRPTLNRAGELAFIAGLGVSDSNPQVNELAIYTGAPGSFRLRVRTGQPAPGMPPGVSFSGGTVYGYPVQAFTQVQHNGQDDIAFRGLVSGPGIDISNNDGLWLGRAGQPLKLIAREGEHPPGAPAGAKFLADNSDLLEYNPAFLEPSINNKGQIVFHGTFLDSTGNYSAGIWGTDLDDSVHLIAYDGQQIDIGGGIIKTIHPLDGIDHFGYGSASEDGQNFLLNDAGQFAFTARFTDGTSAVLIAQVPEPPALVIVPALLLVAGVTCRRARRVA